MLLVDGRDWAVLARLVAADYARLGTVLAARPRPTLSLLQRLDKARAAVSVAP